MQHQEYCGETEWPVLLTELLFVLIVTVQGYEGFGGGGGVVRKQKVLFSMGATESPVMNTSYLGDSK